MIKMFFIINSFMSSPYNASLCFYCPPENVVIYSKEELPLIFPDNFNLDNKPIKNLESNKIVENIENGKILKPLKIIDKEISISLKRRKYRSAEFSIQFVEDFLKYEIDLYSYSDKKPRPAFLVDRQKFIIDDLEESQNYSIRVRGSNTELNTFTKWSKEINFYSLKKSELNNLFSDKSKMRNFVEFHKDKLNKFTLDLSLKILGIKRINILFFGSTGSGKSSSINTFLSTLRTEFVFKALTSSSQISFTQRFSHYCLNQSKSIYLWDIFGFSGDNFKTIIDLLILGQLKDGFKQGDSISGNKINNLPTINDQVHAIVFVIDSTNLELKDTLAEYVDHIKKIQKEDFIPIVILTKIDEYYKKKLGIEKMDCPTSTLFIDGFAEEAIEEFMEKTDNVLTSRDFVLPLINYTGPFMDPDEAIELLTIFNLMKITKTAINHLNKKFENSIIIYNQNNENIGFFNTSSMDSSLFENRDELRKIMPTNLNIENDNINFNFMNSEKQLIKKDIEKDCKIRDIFFVDDNVKNSSCNNAIRIHYEETKQQYKPQLQQKPEPKNQFTEVKSNNSTPQPFMSSEKDNVSESQILIGVWTVNSDNKKDEEKTSICINKESNLFEVREQIEEDFKENNEKLPFVFMDSLSNPITEKEEKNICVQDVILKPDFLLIKPLIYPQITVKNRKTDDLAYLTNVPMNIKLIEFREFLKNNNDADKIIDKKIFKNQQTNIPLTQNIEKSMFLEKVLKFDEKEGPILFME